MAGELFATEAARKGLGGLVVDGAAEVATVANLATGARYTAVRGGGARLDGEPVDLRQPLDRGGALEIFTGKSPEAGDFIRHSAEHVMADAVKRLWPGTPIDAGRQDLEVF